MTMRSIITSLRAGRVTSRGVLTPDGSPFLYCGVLMGDSVLMADGVIGGDLHASAGRAVAAGLNAGSFSHTGPARNAARRRLHPPGGGVNSSHTATVAGAAPG